MGTPQVLEWHSVSESPNMFYGLVINSPEEIAGDYEALPAVFGPQITVALRRAWMIYCGGTDKDIKRLKRTSVEGKIVLFDRGMLDFTIIAACFQQLAAVAVIVINNAHGPAIRMVCDDGDPVAESLEVPCFMISKGDGLNIRKMLDREPIDAALVTEVADVYAWGNGECGQLGLPAPRMFKSFQVPQMVVRHQSVRAVSCGGTFSAVLLDSGNIFTWGDSEHGQLGHGSFVDRIALPRRVEALDESCGEMTVLSCGYFHMICASVTGVMFSWGWNEFGNLGLGDRESRCIPTHVSRMGDKKVRSLSAGYFHSLCLCVNFRKPPPLTREQLQRMTKEENMRRRRENKQKKSAEGKATSKASMKRRGSILSKLKGGASRRNVGSIGGGGSMSMNAAGNRAKGKKSKRSRSSVSASMSGWKPKYVPKSEDEVRTVYSWGDGEHGQLGHGESYTLAYIEAKTKTMPGVKAHAMIRDYTALTTPRIIDALVGMRVTSVDAGGTSSAAVSSRGELLTWGRGLYGGLGHGNEDSVNVPTIVETLFKERVISISMGQHHACAITDHGDVYTWGKGEQGQLGQGEINLDICLLPTRIAALNRRGACRAACANASTYVITERGTVYVFGFNQGGRLGLGDQAAELEIDGVIPNPVHMNTLNGAEIRQVVCGDAHVLVLTEYYHSDAVPERLDQGGPLLDQDEIYVPPESTCCVLC